VAGLMYVARLMQMSCDSWLHGCCEAHAHEVQYLAACTSRVSATAAPVLCWYKYTVQQCPDGGWRQGRVQVQLWPQLTSQLWHLGSVSPVSCDL